MTDKTHDGSPLGVRLDPEFWLIARALDGIPGYVIGLASVALAVLLRWLLDPMLEDEGLYVPLFLALIPLAFLLRPGAYAVSVLAGVLAVQLVLVEPVGSLSLADPAQAVMMGLGLLVAAALGALVWQFRRRSHEALISARKAQVAEEALLEANRKDEFLAALAHELRNPLAPIRTSLELMRLVPDDRRMLEETRSTMERQLRKMVRLIDDLLDVSRITSGKIRLQKTGTSLSETVQDAIETTRPLIEEGQHRLTVTLPPLPLYLHADPARLAQVLSNLLSNAAKYTEQGGHISLAVERQGRHAVVTVKDTGIGIPPDMLESIFEMFTQVPESRERFHSGLGIGLPLAKQLVEMHGGSIEAKSQGPGRGSEFIVCLPLLQTDVHAQVTPPVQEMPTPSKQGNKPTSPRILVVDDNSDAANILGTMLHHLGYETCIAFDGEQALEAAESFRPATVLLDLCMPKLNGYETARRLRETSWARGMRLIALTGYGQEDDRLRAREAGFDQYLVKPVELGTLQRLLADQFSIEQGRPKPP